MLRVPLPAKHIPADGLTHNNITKHAITGFFSKNAIITTENVLFLVFFGSIPFQVPTIRTVVEKRKTDFLSQSRSCLGAGHRWARFLETIQENFPKSIPLWSPKMIIHVTASAKRLYCNNRMEELVPWIWSGTNHHDISSLCPPKDSRSRLGGISRSLRMLTGLIPVCNY